MRLALAIFALLITPAAAFAQSGAAYGGGTQPTGMGRWEEHRQQQEDRKRREDGDDPRLHPDTLLLLPKRQLLNDFATCVWLKSPDIARGALRTNIATPEESAALQGVAKTKECRTPPDVSRAPSEFRGALAEAGVRADSARAAMLGGKAPVPAVRVSIATGRAFMTEYAGCIAAADPVKALGLLGTLIGSNEESAAVVAMASALTNCMPEGAQYRLNPRDLRNHIAVALYRMSEVPNA